MTRMEAELTLKQRIAKALHESASKQDVIGYLNANLDCDILAQAALEAMISEGLAEGLAANALDNVNPIGCCLMDEYDVASVFQSIIKAAIAER